MFHLHFLSINCNGLVSSVYQGGAGSKFSGLCTVLKANNFPDIVALQETNLHDREREEFWRGRLKDKYRTFFSRGGVGQRGTAILVGVNVPFRLLLEHEDLEGRYTLLKGNMCGELVTLGSLYAPNTNKARREFFTNIVGIGLRGILYLMGDYNSVVNVELDRLQSNRLKDEELVDFIAVTDTLDKWREVNPGEKVYSWQGGSDEKSKASRIDLILVSRALRVRVVN